MNTKIVCTLSSVNLKTDTNQLFFLYISQFTNLFHDKLLDLLICFDFIQFFSLTDSIVFLVSSLVTIYRNHCPLLSIDREMALIIKIKRSILNYLFLYCVIKKVICIYSSTMLKAAHISGILFFIQHNYNYIFYSLRWITRKRKVDGPIIMLDLFLGFKTF